MLIAVQSPGPIPPQQQQPAYPPPPQATYAPYMPYQSFPAPTEGKATISLVLGIIALVGSFCYIGFLVGVPALVLGALARRDIARSNGALGGGGLAVGGMVTGGIGAALNALQIGAFALMWVFAMKSATSPPSYTPSYAPPAATTPAPSATVTGTTSAGVYATPSTWGAIHVVPLHRDGTGLRAQLLAQVALAKEAKKQLLVMTTATWSKDASEVERAVVDPRMQAALAPANVALVDVDEYDAELASLRMAKKDVPWFFLVDSSLGITRSMTAGEWADNTPANMAPVLKSFLAGTGTAPKGTSAAPTSTAL
jgi:hypothetical protein